MISAREPRTMSSVIDHSLTPEDRALTKTMRVAMAPGKGQIERGALDAVMQQTPDAAGVMYETGVAGGVSGVWCRPMNALPDAVVLYIHGGAFIAGTANAFRSFVGHIAVRTTVAAFIPEYRLAPESPFPAALDDVRSVYRGLAEQGARSIAIAGDSAGGGLALALLTHAQSEAHTGAGIAPRAGAVMSPWTDLTLTGPSLRDRADADPMLTRDALAAAAAMYLDGHDASDPRASPLYGDFAGLPPLQLHVGTDEILFDDALRVIDRARTARIDATLHVWQGMPHVFQSNVGKLAAADRALDILAHFLRERFGASS